jgi:hypothetical protein
MMSPRARRMLVRAAFAASLGGLFVAGACASVPDEHRFTYVGPLPDNLTLAPDFDAYQKGVDEYLARRCATLDCHGQLGRPLRIYSANGLRAFDAAGGGGFPNLTAHTPLTPDEQKANYVAVIGLEPETMGQVIAGGGTDPKKLLLIKKPLLLESHKGGQVMSNEADDGYRCITSWLAGAGIDQAACDRAAAPGL